MTLIFKADVFTVILDYWVQQTVKLSGISILSGQMDCPITLRTIAGASYTPLLISDKSVKRTWIK